MSDIYVVVIEHLSNLGPVHEDAVNVGIFLKSDRKLAEFRRRVRSVLLSLYLPYELNDPRIAPTLPSAADPIVHMIKLTGADQVDDQLREWLTDLRLQHRLRPVLLLGTATPCLHRQPAHLVRLVAVVRLAPDDLVVTEVKVRVLQHQRRAVSAEGGTLWTMTEITVRVLDESEWALYREVRLRALAESPGAFTASLADEADRDEQFWRDRMTQSYRLLAERGQVPQGIVSLGPYEPDPSAAEVFGLYVVPDARGTGVSWRLVEAAAALATQQGYVQLYYWVGTDNARAVGFANNFGFRTTDYRRPSRSSDPQPGEEIAMVLWLEPDATSAPNPHSEQASTREGPLR